MVAFRRTIAQADLTTEAAGLQISVTIIHGDRDASASVETRARRYAAIIPQAKLVIYEGVAHGVMARHAQRIADDIVRRVRR